MDVLYQYICHNVEERVVGCHHASLTIFHYIGAVPWDSQISCNRKLV